MTILSQLKGNLGLRPHWMNALLLLCAFMTFIYLPWDILLKPLGEDQELWFGLMFTGWAAKAGALAHWFVYGAGTLGFWKMKPWMHPWASLYTLQIAIGMFVWSALGERSSGLMGALITAAIFSALAYALWRAKPKFNG